MTGKGRRATVNDVTYDSGTKLTVAVTIPGGAPTGPIAITVANGDGGTATKPGALTVT